MRQRMEGVTLKTHRRPKRFIEKGCSKHFHNRRSFESVPTDFRNLSKKHHQMEEHP